MHDIMHKRCRDSLTAADVDFVLSALSDDLDENQVVKDLLSSDDTRDVILDETGLVDALLDDPECVSISKELYFYLLVRHCFRQARLDNRDVADYVAALLSAFAERDRMLRPLPQKDFATEWAVDLLSAIGEANEEEAFMIRAHMANYALFMCGLFPARIEHRRHRRGAPGLRYYEAMGKMGYQQAGDCRLAGEYGLDHVFSWLGRCFGRARVALNAMTDRFLFLDADETPGLAT